jgi:hypothetical protein
LDVAVCVVAVVLFVPQGEDEQADFDPHPRQAAATPQPAVPLDSGVAQFDRLAAAVQLPGLGGLHALTPCSL